MDDKLKRFYERQFYIGRMKDLQIKYKSYVPIELDEAKKIILFIRMVSNPSDLEFYKKYHNYILSDEKKQFYVNKFVATFQSWIEGTNEELCELGEYMLLLYNGNNSYNNWSEKTTNVERFMLESLTWRISAKEWEKQRQVKFKKPNKDNSIWVGFAQCTYSKIRIPSKKANKRVWDNFYRIFGKYYAPSDSDYKTPIKLK